jgi:hypothetical protein
MKQIQDVDAVKNILQAYLDAEHQEVMERLNAEDPRNCAGIQWWVGRKQMIEDLVLVMRDGMGIEINIVDYVRPKRVD